MALYCIRLYCMVLRGISWYCMVFHGVVWRAGELPRSASRHFCIVVLLLSGGRWLDAESKCPLQLQMQCRYSAAMSLM